MRGYIKQITLIFIFLWFINRIFGIILVSMLDLISLPNNKIQVQRDRVESFFAENGYEINIIGAYTNGREHEGPFLYGWYWDSFEIGQKGLEVVMLYYYDNASEITGYLEELDKKEGEWCYLSDHFVFYYYGNDEDIITVIKKYCDLTTAYSEQDE